LPVAIQDFHEKFINLGAYLGFHGSNVCSKSADLSSDLERGDRRKHQFRLEDCLTRLLLIPWKRSGFAAHDNTT
jgi:hypothetical protein